MKSERGRNKLQLPIVQTERHSEREREMGGNVVWMAWEVGFLLSNKACLDSDEDLTT